MTAGQPIAAGSPPDDRGPAVSVFFWSLIQIAVLAFAAGEVPLVVVQSQPTERWALSLLLAVQFAISALFAGPLLGSASRTIINIALAWPMLQLAGLLAGEPQTHILAASGAVTLWLVGLACWTALLPHGARPIVSALASAWALGGTALAYCHADFGSAPGQSVFPMAAWLSPLLGAIQVSTDPAHWSTWSVLVVHCGLAVTAVKIAQIYQRSPDARGA